MAAVDPVRAEVRFEASLLLEVLEYLYLIESAVKPRTGSRETVDDSATEQERLAVGGHSLVWVGT